jgi:hypothetical protein
MFSPDDILRLAHAYSEATGLSYSRISRRIVPHNDKILIRLTSGLGISTRTAVIASAFFQTNWPQNATWPPEVPGKPRKRVPAVISRRKQKVLPAAERIC